MKFTYNQYTELIKLISEKGYQIADYHDWIQYDKCVILRHDIDTDVKKAYELASLEYKLGVKGTYFVLVTSNFYNPNSCRNRKILIEMLNMGHSIGLHFDEMAYPNDVGDVDKIKTNIDVEIKILSSIIDKEVDIFSYHRPSKKILDADIAISGKINSYSNIFFNEFKYLSDSRMHWREPVMDIIEGKNYTRLHILTHPFWYHNYDKDMKGILESFVKGANYDRYIDLRDNFTNLEDVLEWEEQNI